MGLALIGDGGGEVPNVDVGPGWPSDRGFKSEGVDLDAMGGQGAKGNGDGKCHVCGGDGHFARDCASVPPISPMSPECHGCNGRGHLRNDCPTAHPELKAKGTGKGWGGGKDGGKGNWGNGSGKGNWGKGGGKGNGNGGKGKGYGGNWGKGKGKGVCGPDLMGSLGGEKDWTVVGNQWGHVDNGQWDNGQLRCLQPVYSRSLAMIQPR